MAKDATSGVVDAASLPFDPLVRSGQIGANAILTNVWGQPEIFEPSPKRRETGLPLAPSGSATSSPRSGPPLLPLVQKDSDFVSNGLRKSLLKSLKGDLIEMVQQSQQANANVASAKFEQAITEYDKGVQGRFNSIEANVRAVRENDARRDQQLQEVLLELRTLRYSSPASSAAVSGASHGAVPGGSNKKEIE